MITIIPGTNKKETAQVIDRLKRLSLAFSVEKNKENSPVRLADGDQQYSGLSEIDIYLIQLENELKSWYYCAC